MHFLCGVGADNETLLMLCSVHLKLIYDQLARTYLKKKIYNTLVRPEKILKKKKKCNIARIISVACTFHLR